jgi:hypothetical protein
MGAGAGNEKRGDWTGLLGAECDWEGAEWRVRWQGCSEVLCSSSRDCRLSAEGLNPPASAHRPDSLTLSQCVGSRPPERARVVRPCFPSSYRFHVRHRPQGAAQGQVGPRLRGAFFVASRASLCCVPTLEDTRLIVCSTSLFLMLCICTIHSLPSAPIADPRRSLSAPSPSPHQPVPSASPYHRFRHIT